ncbi:hypothetical protein [Microbacterium sp. AK031]|uniref:hypothetical protein n=1 Tax=Microbacterium sp. AK031 TaxID=2723076 RepID=UPI002168E9FA|nr:hypothetical protein [Microbacterium sp. AK031]MCS3841758.1 hypothetical protein [Microbacterium sp. AK031]
MSAEMITTIVGVVSLLLALAAGFGWIIHRTDAQLAGVRVEIADTRRDLGVRMDKVTEELVDVKIAVARVEGCRGT